MGPGNEPATKHDIALVRQDIVRLDGDVAVLKQDVAVLKQDVAVLKQDVAVLKQDVAVLKQDVAVLKQDVAVLKQDVAVLKQDVAELKKDVAGLKQDLREGLDMLRGEVIHGYTDLLEKITERETSLLNAFYSFAAGNNKRVVELEGNEAAIRSRLGTLEDRMLQVERRLNFPQFPPPAS